MTLPQSFLLALVLGGSLHAAPLTVTELGFGPPPFPGGQPGSQLYAIDGPRGREIHAIDCCNEPAAQTILQNDRWQLIISMDSGGILRWYSINYGQGPGEYGVDEHPRIGNYVSPLEVPGFTIPPPFCCLAVGGPFLTEFHDLDNSSNAHGTATFAEVQFQDMTGGTMDFVPLIVPFTLDLGPNPFFVVPEPGSVSLAGLGLLGAWRLRRRPRLPTQSETNHTGSLPLRAPPRP